MKESVCGGGCVWRRVCVKVCVREGVCVCGVYMHVEGVCGGCV